MARFLILAILVCGSASAQSLHGFDLQGHRGYRARWPENTWVGMKAALEAGVTTLEMDVVISKDRQVVLSHEPWMNIEIKSRAEWDGVFHPHPEEYVRLVLDVVAASGMKDRCMIQSFDRRIPRWVYAVDSTLELVVLEEYRRTPFKTRVAQRSLGDVGLEVGTYSPHYRMVTRRLVRRMHQRGIRVVPWTVNEPRVMCGLVQKGVDGLITDDPGIFMELKHPRAGQTP